MAQSFSQAEANEYFNNYCKNKAATWNAFRSIIGVTPQGAAALFAGFSQESYVNSYAVEGMVTDKYKASRDRLIAAINNKSYSKYDFQNRGRNGDHYSYFDWEGHTIGPGFGLMQWTTADRKGELWDFTLGGKSGKVYSIDSFVGQTYFIKHELDNVLNGNDYRQVASTLRNPSASLRDCCIKVVKNYIGNPNTSTKKHSQKHINTFIDYIVRIATQCYSYYLNTPISNVINENQVNNTNTFLQIVKNEYNTNGNKTLSKDNKYTRYTKQGPVEWCTSFVAWCWHEAGIQYSVPPYAYSCSKAYGNFINSKDESIRKCWIDAINLQPGDALIYQWPGSSYVCNHIGIVVAAQKQSDGKLNISTIEGNVGGSKIKYFTNILINSNGISSNRNGNALVRGGIRLEGANAVGGTTPNISGGTLSQFAQTAINIFFGGIQSAFSGLSDGFNSIFKIGAAVSTKEIEYKEVNVNINRDIITSIDADANSIRAKGQSLLTAPTLVEAPFVTLQVGDVTLGTVFNNTTNRQYPNYITSIDVVKVNGTVNQYTIQMVYQIEAGQDPNLIDKIFSKVGYGNVYITYGDYNAPAFIYRTEKAIITNLQSNVDFSNSRITYVLSCTSDSLALMGGNYSFPARTESPSTIIYGMLYEKNSTYKLLDIFPGMKNKSLVQSKGLIPRDDASVKIEAKQGMDALSYINYLSTCMSPIGTDSDSALKNANYYFTIHDDYDGTFGGPYFKITKVSANTNDLKVIAYNSPNTYEIDIGYPGDTLVTSFRLNNNNSWALLYNYSNKVNMPVYSYNIDNEGRLIETSSPNILLSSKYNRITETQRDWWTQMTRFPIQATLEIKGLLKPVLLMTYIRINTLFYGQRHSSSGLYIVTKQADRIDGRGYRTTLSLTRVAGDLDTIQTKSQQITTKVVTGYKNTGANPEEEEKQEKIREFFNTTFTNTLNMTYKEYEEKEKKIKENNEKKVKEVNDVVNKYGIYIDKQDMTCDVNGILWITATVDKDLKDSTITWASSDTSIATVYNGKVTCLKPGKVNITATNSEGKSATCIVTIQQPADGTVTLDKKEVTCDVDGILWLVATVWGSENNEVTWSSTDESIATVVNGKVTMHTYGTVYITAKASNDKSDWCKIIVRQPWIKLNKSKIIYKETDTTDYWLIPDYAPKNLTITWSSSDTSIVTAYNGHIELAEPFKIGTSTITATLSSGESAKCVVQTEYENPVTKIVLNKTDEHIKVDDEMWITATITPKDATNQDVVWTSSDNSIATVYNGKVTGIKAGKVTITATTYNNLSAKCSVDVLNK